MSQVLEFKIKNLIYKYIIINYKNNNTLFTNQLSDFLCVSPKSIVQNFSRNKKMFIENDDYYLLSGQELKKFKTELKPIITSENFKKVSSEFENNIKIFQYLLKSSNTIYLWTRTGIIKQIRLRNYCSDDKKEILEIVHNALRQLETTNNTFEQLDEINSNFLQPPSCDNSQTIIQSNLVDYLEKRFSLFESAIFKKINENNELFKNKIDSIYTRFEQISKTSNYICDILKLTNISNDVDEENIQTSSKAEELNIQLNSKAEEITNQIIKEQNNMRIKLTDDEMALYVKCQKDKGIDRPLEFIYAEDNISDFIKKHNVTSITNFVRLLIKARNTKKNSKMTENIIINFLRKKEIVHKLYNFPKITDDKPVNEYLKYFVRVEFKNDKAEYENSKPYLTVDGMKYLITSFIQEDIIDV